MTSVFCLSAFKLYLSDQSKNVSFQSPSQFPNLEGMYQKWPLLEIVHVVLVVCQKGLYLLAILVQKILNSRFCIKFFLCTDWKHSDLPHTTIRKKKRNMNLIKIFYVIRKKNNPQNNPKKQAKKSWKKREKSKQKSKPKFDDDMHDDVIVSKKKMSIWRKKKKEKLEKKYKSFFWKIFSYYSYDLSTITHSCSFFKIGWKIRKLGHLSSVVKWLLSCILVQNFVKVRNG